MKRKLQTGPARIRPRYKRVTPLPSCQVVDQIIEGLIEHKEEVTGSTLENHAYLKIPEKDKHYWSPEFHVTVEKRDEGSLVRGVVGPNPRVWTMFMFFYSGTVVLFFLGTSMGVSQWMLGVDAPWLWSIPACILLYLIILGSARYGQYRGRKQMIRLWRFLDHAIDRGEKESVVEEE